jgi:ABC-type polysaccharide/polyol phosphate transport system ATPase subunit
MSEPVIDIRHLSKNFRVFRSPFYRVLDVLGCPVPPSAYEEFQALRDVHLSVPAGQRLGIIGCNGAGKSTLLKIVAGMMQPTGGDVRVRGTVQALLDLGSLFHPDFTGRENVLAALAYRGVVGMPATRALDEVVAFSELAGFIDKPLKTYSSGMHARLAFAVATTINPDVLVIDEVMSAGDAYFVAKSLERMRQLVETGATVLLVSHELEQVTRFCDEAVWIDRGQVVQKGPSLDVVKAYARHIQMLEDRRLRDKNRSQARTEAPAASGSDPSRRVARWPGEGSVVIREVALLNGKGVEQAVYAPGEPMSLRMTFASSRTDVFDILPAVAVYRLDGVLVSRHHADKSASVHLTAGEPRAGILDFGRLNLGDGHYVVSAGLFRASVTESERYDLIDRSYEFRVVAADPQLKGPVFHHESRWRFPVEEER